MNNCIATCREEDGGSPSCKLGFLTQKGNPNKRMNKTVEIKGRVARDILEYGKIVTDPTNCDYFVISDSPDWEDDLNGYPFASEVGDKLLSLMQEASLPLDKVYVTYMTKCKPPQGRPPAAAEIKACRKHLKQELEFINPKFIILLGAKTLQAFRLNSLGGLNAIHGKVYTKPYIGWEDGPEFQVMPTFSPAQFVFRPNASLENRCLDDWKIAESFGKRSFKPYQAKYTLIDSIEKLQEFVDQVKQHSWFAFDTESCALRIRQMPMLCASFSLGKGNNYILPILRHSDVDKTIYWKGEGLRNEIKDTGFFVQDIWPKNIFDEKLIPLLKEIFEDPNIAKAAHNIKYDIQVCRWWLNIHIQGFLFDTMVMHHMLDEIPPHDLESLADFEFSVGDYSANKRKITGQGSNLIRTYDQVPDEILWPYAATDAECVYRLCEVYYNRLQEKPHLWKLYCEESEPGLRAMYRAEWHGNLIDQPIVKDMHEEYEDKQKALLAKMKIKAPTVLDDKGNVKAFNPMSTNDVRDALIALGYEKEISNKYASGGYSTSKEILMQLKEYYNEDLAKWILEYRSNRKILSTYLEAVLNDLDTDGYARYTWFPLTTSARQSCRFLHQIPNPEKERVDNNKPVLRDLFIVPEDYIYLYLDYSQIELRVLAILAQDETMISMFENNEDIHNATAFCLLENVMNLKSYDEISQYNRQLGKTVNFGLAYGSEGHQVIKTCDWEDPQGVKHSITWDMFHKGMQNFKKLFPGLSSYLEITPDLARMNNGTLRTPFGRERRLGSALNHQQEGKRKAAEREAVNFTIQSTASAITLRTIILIDKVLQDYISKDFLQEDDIVLINTVHDSMAYKVKEKYIDWFMQTIKQVAERPIPELQNKSFPCKIGTGKNWREAEAKAT